MKKFYSEKETKLMVANAATTAAITAKNEGTKKSACFGTAGMIFGAVITFTVGRSYCKKIEEAAEESNRALKRDVNILRAGIEEADKKFSELNTDISQLPAFVEARKLINEKGGMTPPAPKEDKKKKEEKEKKGGDK